MKLPFNEKDMGENFTLNLEQLAEDISNKFNQEFQKEIEEMGIKGRVIRNGEQIYLCFFSEEDLNLFRLTGKTKEGSYDIFRGSGVSYPAVVQYHTLTEIYG